ncbi:MAG: geranylgeranylglycerol-phosphate geranylgeranyltransferase [Bacteroidota bacterium]
MSLTAAFLRLIRWPNLVFIAITQWMVYSCLYRPLFHTSLPEYDDRSIYYWIIASVFIAAAGYVINDYFDINIDEVNRPDRQVLDKIISRRWAMLWHFMLSALGVGFTALAINWNTHAYLFLANLGCVIALWFYSTRLKKTLLVGNVLIALLTSWTIWVIFLSRFSWSELFGNTSEAQQKFTRVVLLYTAFSFVITLIREAVKDMEDRIGDARAGCRTLPIVWGFPAAKVYTSVWTVVLIGLLILLQAYVLPFGWWPASLYALSALIVPLVIFLTRLIVAQQPSDFTLLSRLLKWVMLAGILSMIFFYLWL